MVIQSRTETRRNRVLYFLTFILSITVLIGVFRQYEQSSAVMQALLIVLAASAAGAILIAILQLYAFPKRSHALIIQREGDMIIATNAVHEGFKLRFLRDVLNEHVFVFSDEDRDRLKALETDGYYPAMLVRDVRKVLLLRLCTMVFDDVFVVDNADRWEHHDSSNTSEPSFHKREMPPLRTWKGMHDISA
jgi:hypothetical protein